MSIGSSELRMIRRVEAMLDRLGMRMIADYGSERIKVLPKDEDHLPCYRHDVSLIEGTIEEIAMWCHGIDWARTYDHALGLKTGQRRERSEQKVRNRNLLRSIESNAKS